MRCFTFISALRSVVLFAALSALSLGQSGKGEEAAGSLASPRARNGLTVTAEESTLTGIVPMAVVGSTAFFTANDTTHGAELWKIEAASGQPTLVKDIVPGSGSGITQVLPPPAVYTPAYGKQVAVVGGSVLLFLADDRTHGTELWRSDGTSAGTYLLKDIQPGTASSSMRSFCEAGSLVYFVDGASELWKTDGTAAGTVKVRGTASAPFAYPTLLGTAGGVIYFSAETADVEFTPHLDRGYELWKTDGTLAGCNMVADLAPGQNDSSFSLGCVSLGSTFYFSRGGTGTVPTVELWKTEGTYATTVMVKDIIPDYSSHPISANLKVVYF